MGEAEEQDGALASGDSRVDEAIQEVEDQRDIGRKPCGSPNWQAWVGYTLAAEVRRLRELVLFREKECAIETAEKSRSWQEAAQLRDSNAKLRTDDWKLRQDLKTACENAVEFQATANTLREENARLKQENTFRTAQYGEASQHLQRELSAPRYSTEAVEALLDRIDRQYVALGATSKGDKLHPELKRLGEAVRASREPKHGQG